MPRIPAGMRKTAKGGYESRFTVEGKRYSVYGRTVRECRDRELARRREIEEVWRVMSIPDSWNETADWKQFNEMVDKVVESGNGCFGALSPGRIERQQLKQVQLVLSRDYSVSTVNKCMSLIRTVLEAAQEEGMIVRNPAKRLRSLRETKKPARETIHRALTREETEAFFHAAREYGSWYLPLYSFLLNTGCRFGEAGALMEKDIRDGGIRIERTLTKTLDGRLTVGRDAKTGCSVRMIPARREALDAIREQQRQNNRQFTDDGGPIFRAPRGGLLGARCVGKDIDALCRAAGIERFTAHAFRDTFATRAIESGMQPKTLQEILGHADIGVTMNLYAHVMEDTKRMQMEAVRV